MSLRLGLALYIRLSDIFRCLSFAISVGESITLTALAENLQCEDMGQHTRFWYYRIGGQRRLGRACTYAQTRPSHSFSHIQSNDTEEAADQI